MANPLEVFRFRSAARMIAQTLGVDPAPDCVVKNGRTTLTFRKLGGSRWAESDQMAFALRAAEVARRVFLDDDRRQLRAAAARAVEVAFEDAAVVQGCAVSARWECTVPGQR
jgi:hypothetical protein